MRSWFPPNWKAKIWINSICINQSNDDEKSQQVAMMAQIYTKAYITIAWVGEESIECAPDTSLPYTDLAISFLLEFATEIRSRQDEGIDIHECKCFRDLLGSGSDRNSFWEGGPTTLKPTVMGLSHIFRNRWWGRVWVLQEIAFARLPILKFTPEMMPYHIIRGYAQARKNSSFRTPNWKALDLLSITKVTGATDPRDKIFGILGFFGSPDTDPENILPVPDYSRTTAEVYSDVARAIIFKTRSLEVMSDCYGNLETIPGLPSWAPSWHHRTWLYFPARLFKASNTSSVIYKDDEDRNFLTIKEKRIDSLKAVAPCPKLISYTNTQYILLWRQWVHLALSLQSYPTGEDLHKALLYTLCFGCSSNITRLSESQLEAGFQFWLRILTSASASATSNYNNTLDTPISDSITNSALDTEADANVIFSEDSPAFSYCYRIQDTSKVRLLATTTKSFLALVPIISKPNDEIVIFSRGSIPYVVRPIVGGSDYQSTAGAKNGHSKKPPFTLVGPCYVHGIMDGEAVPKEEEKQGKGVGLCDSLEWFTLR
ncbi:hypothetical protein BP6252_10986 [Coleophoma cylindrospora]|uniref:Heterokaryon incompatibility domain-containing protein n=1 Tax=Coleophoma cylindrospora TaxID=1849047 RepID=A0A3D8QNZ0_9HELO|nr:hypothetical protein BP6252_10986 [Coleophoma cylindrospora]